MASPLLYIIYGASGVSVTSALLAIRSARYCRAAMRAEQERALIKTLLA
jgi:hypothetical protein